MWFNQFQFIQLKEQRTKEEASIWILSSPNLEQSKTNSWVTAKEVKKIDLRVNIGELGSLFCQFSCRWNIKKNKEWAEGHHLILWQCYVAIELRSLTFLFIPPSQYYSPGIHCKCYSDTHFSPRYCRLVSIKHFTGFYLLLFFIRIFNSNYKIWIQ